MRRGLLLAVVAVVLGGPVAAQMDMLPQVFRDLPPEIQEGLPETMTFAEYRALNRSIDFYTMFMSIFVPGYGLFEVERPDLAWPVVAARAVSYGLMGTAVGLQWNHFYDLVDTQQLAEEDFRRFLTNSFIFGGGVVLGGFTWAFDVMGAYSIAKREKDLVQYRYGVRTSITGGLRGEANPTADERYLRRMLAQESDDAIVGTLLVDLPAYARLYPDEPFSGAALYFTALLYAERADDSDALRYALRAAYRYPGGERSPDAVRLVARLAQRNSEWGMAYDQLAELVSLPNSADADARHYLMASRLAAFESPVLKQAALAETRALLQENGNGSHGSRALALAGDLLVALGRPDAAASYLAAVAVAGPGEPLWAEKTLMLAELYLGPLSDTERAAMLLQAVVEEAPGSDEAERAGELLGQ